MDFNDDCKPQTNQFNGTLLKESPEILDKNPPLNSATISNKSVLNEKLVSDESCHNDLLSDVTLAVSDEDMSLLDDSDTSATNNETFGSQETEQNDAMKSNPENTSPITNKDLKIKEALTCGGNIENVETSLKEEKSALSPTDNNNGKNISFVDSLLNKIRCKNSDSSESESLKLQQLPSDSEEDLLVEVELPPVRYNKPANPKLLPTPIVHNQKSMSAFANSEEEYRRAVAKHKHKTNIYHQEHNNHLDNQSEAPKMKTPPLNIYRPRTLAEKRQMVNNNVKFLMVEQESKIFKQVQRKNEHLSLNFNLLDSMMLNNIPIKHGPFKVLTWLRTRDEKFTMQYLNIENKSYKLNGSQGNHSFKYVSAKSSNPLPKYQETSLRSTRCCKGGRMSKADVKSLWNMKSIRRYVLEESVDSFKRIDTKFLENQLVLVKPRPLSKKIEFINKNRKLLPTDEDAAFLGDYAKFQMPDVKLKVNISSQTSLDPTVKKYLNEILPHKDLDENWCQFALTQLRVKEKEESEECHENFEFIIPYQDNKREILVREINKSMEDNERLRILYTADNDEPEEDEMEWTFCKDIDTNDQVECEVVDIIKDLTNSVFINLNDNLFTKEDPHDRTTISVISPIKSKEAIDELSSLIKPDTTKKVLMELKRLNANFYKSESLAEENENDIRHNATAHLGKIERELRPTVIVTESDTVVLGEKESRRTKRPPKKFDDYENTMTKSFNSESDDEPASKKLKCSNADTEGILAYESQRSSVLSQDYEELKAIKQEVKKMLHVSVDVRRMDEVDNVEAWCMVHKLYKCFCKRLLSVERFCSKETAVDKVHQKLLNSTQPTNSIQPQTSVVASKVINSKKSTVSTPEQFLSPKSEEKLIDDGFSRRVLPVNIEKNKMKTRASAILNSYDGLPKIEIVNLCELINGGIGPIFINVYDDKAMRLNPILRSVLNNKSALIYFDGTGYFIDKTRVDVNKLDFSSVLEELEHPIFIIQAKEDFPLPVSSTMTDDYVKVLFNLDSEEVIQICDKTALKELVEIIESILRNVRKKIETKINGELNDLVKEQLSMLTRDRSKSTSTTDSVSSNHSSPLSFQGNKLTEAPPPGHKTQLMEEFNQIFSSRMKRLVGLINSNTMGLSPSNEMLNKFYIYQWHLLLQSFEEDLIQIWQVRLESENGEGFQMMALTDSREIPEIEHARKENIVNIRKLKFSDDISELTRLILLRVEKASMKNMTILLYGCKGYFRICGILNSKDDYVNGFVAKPTRATHPRIAAKIQKIYHIWYASRKARETKRHQQIIYEKGNERKSLLKVNHRKIEAKKQGQADYKWFLFNITNDFSDIYIKSWGRYLSYKVIMDVIIRAKAQNRAIALTECSKKLSKWPKIYALPGAPLKFKDNESMTDNFLIFGPYRRSSNSNLLLMQNIDGDLMLRDEYEKRNNIQRSKRTRCLWIYANTLQCLNNADPYAVKLMWANNEKRNEVIVKIESKIDQVSTEEN